MNEKIIWDFLYAKTKNPYGTAALMGNLMAESSLNPMCAEVKKAGYKSVVQYVRASDDGVHDFAHDGIAFGLVQWCFWSRKQELLNYAKKKGYSVGSIQAQLEYMWEEFQKYITAYEAVMYAKDIRTASDAVMLKYERPANTSEAMKRRRADYAQGFYDEFAGGVPVGKKKVRITEKNVNLRCGNGKNYAAIAKAQKGQTFNWIATAENGWHAIEGSNRVYWVTEEFSEIIEEG